MARRFPDKAQITYNVEGKNSTLRFHSVMVEEHEVTAEVTKYPTQSGFNISNHSITDNRRVSITGIVSNTVLSTQAPETLYGAGKNNQKLMFAALVALIQNKTPCEVQTNLSTYTPVIFTKFRTKQEAGMTDAMTFTISGVEVRTSTGINSTVPTPLSFTPLSPEQTGARLQELREAGFNPSEDAILSEVSVSMGESFSMDTYSKNGKAQRITYESVGYDPTNNIYKYKCHTSDIELFDAPNEDESSFNWYKLLAADEAGETLLPSPGLETGIDTFGACLSETTANLVIDNTNEFVNTTLGTLRKSTYGAAYDTFGVNGDQSFGQELLAIGTDCLVAGALGTVGLAEANEFDQSPWPTAEDMAEGAARAGDAVLTDIGRATAPVTLTKISEGRDTVSFLGGLL